MGVDRQVSGRGGRERRADGGFTLVELLVVIVILGILAGVVVFAVNGIQDRGQLSACQEDARIVRTAVESYRGQNSSSANPTMNDLVTAGFISQASSMHTLSYTGVTLNLAKAGSCTSQTYTP